MEELEAKIQVEDRKNFVKFLSYIQKNIEQEATAGEGGITDHYEFTVITLPPPPE